MTINLNSEQAYEASRLLAGHPGRSVSIANGFDFDQPGPSRVLVFGDEVHVIDVWGEVVQLAPSEAGCPTCGAYPNEDCKRPATENCLHPKAERQSTRVHANGVIEVLDVDAYRAKTPGHVVATCGTCGRSWDDSHATGVTPVPSGRCPFEYDHESGRAVATDRGGKDPAVRHRTGDPYGTARSVFDPSARRFSVYVEGHEPDEEPGWRYKLRVIDFKYNDSDGYPIEAVAGGDSWEAAFKTAASFIEQALATDECVF